MLIVVKAGGRIIERGLPSPLVNDMKEMAASNRLIFVHGGGIEVTEIASQLGKEQKFVTSPEGFRSRYTDRETVNIYTMVMAGKLNKQIVMELQRGGLPAIGFSGLDGLLLRAKRKKRLIILDERGRKRVIDGGYTGKIQEVNTKLLRLIMDGGYLPVVSPVAISEEFEPLNVDGDRTAAYIAGFLKADMMILLTDVEGVFLDNTLVQTLTVSQARKGLEKIGPGMITKVFAATEAIDMGVEEVVITSGLQDKPITSAIISKCGTVIKRE